MYLVVLIVSLFVSLVPSFMLYKWFKKKSDDEKYKEICKNAFRNGFVSMFIIILVSAVFAIIGKLSGLQNFNPLLYQVYYKFVVLAFSEELVKF